jgi:hypothetical protein
MCSERERRPWFELLLALAAFGVLAGLIEAAGASRELVLPAWAGFVTALALADWRSRSRKSEACRARLSEGAHP